MKAEILTTTHHHTQPGDCTCELVRACLMPWGVHEERCTWRGTRNIGMFMCPWTLTWHSRS